MSVSDVSLLHAVVTLADTSPVKDTQLESADLEFNDQLISHIAAGDTHPRFVAKNGSEPGIPIGTQQVAAFLSQCGNMGANVSPADIYYRKVSNLTGRVAHGTTEHIRFRATLARMYLDSISAGNRQEAVASGRIVPVADGTNAVLIRSGSVAITTITPTTAEGFVLGPISYGTSSAAKLQGCDGLDVSLNASQMEFGDESEEAITFAAGDTIAPTVSFTTTDVSVDALRGTPVENFRVHLLRKKDENDTYGDGESQHIRCTITKGVWLVQRIAGRPAARQVTVVASGDDANGFSDAPIAWAVNAAVALE